MKNIMKIYCTDIKNIVTNWAAAIVIGGLIVLPSLYAWFNIAAMWDPYSKTGDLPVAIVNEDTGATVRDKEIDVGKDLVKELKENKTLEWHFTDRKTAMDKVEYGDYFAMIVIPKNFSEKLASVISDHPEKAEMEYYVNEKINSVSPKITEKGATVIAEQVSSKFISTVNGVIFDLFNELGIELEKNLPDIENFEQYVFTLEKNLPEISNLLNQSITDANSAQKIINQAQGKIPEVQKLTDNGLTTINKTTDFLNEAENRLNKIRPQVNADIEKVQNISKDVNDFITKIQDTTIDSSQGSDLQENLQNQLNDAIKTVNTIDSALKQLDQLTPKQEDSITEKLPEGTTLDQEQLDQAIQKTTELKAALENAQADVTNIEKIINENRQKFDQTIEQLSHIADKTAVKLDTFVNEYKNTIEPTITNEVAKAKSTLASAKGILGQVQSTLPEVQRILNNTEGSLKEGQSALNYAHGEFPYINDKVKQLADKIRSINKEADINEIIQLLQNDPNAEEGFFEEPVKLNQNKLFPIENYGTGMTPFYTVLAIWVGGLLLISLLTVDVKNAEAFTGKQIYFGRFFTFMTIGFFQTLIVTSGDLFLLGVSAKEPFWLIIFGLFTSLIFILIVYTLVSVFGNVGKALAIIMLVLQIAGSGGTYPVALLPGFFQSISPFLPFTYAVDLMREAVGGIVWQRVGRDILFLIIFGAIFLILGAFFKEPINKRTKVLMEKSKESGIIH